MNEFRPLGMKEREKVELGEDHDWFLLEAKREEPRGIMFDEDMVIK